VAIKINLDGGAANLIHILREVIHPNSPKMQ